jgi:hypothetical protein
VLFETSSTKFWVAHAGKDGSPAANQHYLGFQLSELLKHTCPSDAKEITGPKKDKVVTQAGATASK